MVGACVSSCIVDIQFPLYAVAIVGSFLMVVMERMEKDKDIKKYRKFSLASAEFFLMVAVVLSVLDIILLLTIHLLTIHLSDNIAIGIAGLSIAFVTIGAVISSFVSLSNIGLLISEEFAKVHHLD